VKTTRNLIILILLRYLEQYNRVKKLLNAITATSALAFSKDLKLLKTNRTLSFERSEATQQETQQYITEDVTLPTDSLSYSLQ